MIIFFRNKNMTIVQDNGVLNGVTTGDKLYSEKLYSENFYNNIVTYTVVRTTKTQVICENNIRFKICDGYMIGVAKNNSNKISVKIMTPEIMNEIKITKLIKNIEKVQTLERKFKKNLTNYFAKKENTNALQALQLVSEAINQVTNPTK